MARATSIEELVFRLKLSYSYRNKAGYENLLGRIKPFGPSAVRSLVTWAVRESHFCDSECSIDCAVLIDARLTGDELLKYVGDPDEKVRVRACNGLARLKDARAIPYLRSLLKAPKHWMRCIAMHGLGDLGDEGSVDDLISFLGSSDHNSQASFALASIGGIQVIDKLMSLLNDPNLEAQRWAIICLGSLRATQALKPLVLSLSQESSETLPYVISALGKIGDVTVIPHLLPFCRASEPQVRKNATLALGSLPDASSITAVLPMLFDAESSVRIAAANALGKLRAAEATDVLNERLANDPESNVRMACVEALGEIGDPRALEPIEGLRTRIRKLFRYKKQRKAAERAVMRALYRIRSANGGLLQ